MGDSVRQQQYKFYLSYKFLQMLEKIEHFVSLPNAEYEEHEGKLTQQFCYYNLNNLQKHISKRGMPDKSKTQPVLPKLKKEKEEMEVSSVQWEKPTGSITADTLLQPGHVCRQTLSTVEEWCRVHTSQLEQLRRTYQHKNTEHKERKVHQFRMKIKKQTYQPVAKLPKCHRYFQPQQVHMPKEVIEKIGLYQAGQIFKPNNINRYIDENLNKEVKPITNNRYFNCNPCQRNQLFLTNPAPIQIAPEEFIDVNKSRKEHYTKSKINIQPQFTIYDKILQDQTPQEMVNVKPSYSIITIQDYQILKNESYSFFIVQNIEDIDDIQFILEKVIIYLKILKISNFTFKFNKQSFMKEIWRGRKVNFKKFDKLLNINFKINKQIASNSSRTLSKSALKIQASIFTSQKQIILEVIRIWKDRKHLNQKKNLKKREKILKKWVALRFGAKMNIKRSKEVKKRRALELHRNFLNHGEKPEIQIYLPSFSECQFLRSTTQYMETFENLYYHIWRQNTSHTLLVLPAINENLLNIYKEKIKGCKNITIICPESHNLFPKTLPLSGCLFFSHDALCRVKELIVGKVAVIIPGRHYGSNSHYEFALSDYLNVPLHCSLKIENKLCGVKKLFKERSISTPEYKVIQAKSCLDDLIGQLAQLIMKNGRVNTWVLKMDGEFNGRGVATFSTHSSKKLRDIMVEAQRTQMKTCKLEEREYEEQRVRLIEYLDLHFRLKLKVNFENCIFRVEEYINNFLKVGGIIEEYYENSDTYELMFNITPQAIREAREDKKSKGSCFISFCQNYSVDFVNRISTFATYLNKPIKGLYDLGLEIEECLIQNDYQGYVSVNIISCKGLLYAIDLKPFMTSNSSLSFFLHNLMIRQERDLFQKLSPRLRIKQSKKSAMMEEFMRKDDENESTDSMKIVREKLCHLIEDQEDFGYTYLFIPTIIFTDVDEITKTELIEELVIQNWENIEGTSLHTNAQNTEPYENIKCLYMSMGLTLSLLIYGKNKELKKMKKIAIDAIRELSDKVGNLKIYRGKQQIRDVFQFGDLIRAITKIRI